MTIKRRIGSFLIVCVSLVSFVSGARAAFDPVVVQQLGILSVGGPSTNIAIIRGEDEVFNDIISFQVSGPASGEFTAENFLSPLLFDISGFEFSVIVSTSGNFDTFDVFDPPGPGGSGDTLMFAGLSSPGLYGLLFTGVATGPLGGFVLGNLSVVPLPPALWLFLSALVGLVAVVRHKRQKNPNRLAPEPALAA